MIGRLLLKILPKKKAKVLSERELEGRNRVGFPTMQLSNEIDELVYKYYRTIRPVVKLYKDTLFFKWAPSLIENEFSDEQLKQLSSRNLQMVYLILFRDMLRHVAPYLLLSNAQENWQDMLCQEVLDNCNMLQDKDDKDIPVKTALFAESMVYDVECEQPADWINPLVQLVGFPADKLYECHRSLVLLMIKKLDKNKK